MEDVLPLLTEVDLVFTSPPYNLGTTTGGGFPVGHYLPEARLGQRGGVGKWSGGALADGYGIHSDAMLHDEYIRWQHRILRLCWQTLTDTGAIYYNQKPRVLGGEVVTPLVYNPGLPIRQVVIWARAGGINFSPSFYVPTHEWILILAKPDFRLKSKGASGIGDVWVIPQESGTVHPAPFPLALPSRAIETTASRLVLDPFCGSGTSLVAAKSHGVKAIGIEIEERWCDLAASRCAQDSLFAELA